MGAGNASTGGGGGGGSPNQMAKDKAKAKAEKDRIENAKTKDKFGYTKPKSTLQKIAEKSPVYNFLKNNPISKKTEEVNRNYYETNVKNYKGNTKGNYEDYIRARSRGEVDAMGRVISNQGSDNRASDNNSILTKSDQPNDSEPVTAPSETKTTETTETEKKYDVRKTKKKGRKENILTSAKGVTKTSSDYSLGKPSLLGMV